MKIFPQTISYLINYEGDCRAAPATPGLLKIQLNFLTCIRRSTQLRGVSKMRNLDMNLYKWILSCLGKYLIQYSLYNNKVRNKLFRFHTIFWLSLNVQLIVQIIVHFGGPVQG